MKDLTLDFGLLIAYAIPGALGLAGLSHWQKPLRDLFADAYRGENTLGAVTALFVLSIVAGMIISVVRASTVDHLFEVPFKLTPRVKWLYTVLAKVPVLGWYLERYVKHGPDGDSFIEGAKREEPNYVTIASKGRLDVLREAVASDKRPYQFYGNTILAILLYVGFLLPAGVGGTFNADRALRIALLLVAIGPLFTAARTSHNRYMKSVFELNS